MLTLQLALGLQYTEVVVAEVFQTLFAVRCMVLPLLSLHLLTVACVVRAHLPESKNDAFMFGRSCTKILRSSSIIG